MSQKSWNKMSDLERQLHAMKWEKLSRMRRRDVSNSFMTTIAGYKVLISWRRCHFDGFAIIGGYFSRGGLGLEQAARYIRILQQRRPE